MQKEERRFAVDWRVALGLILTTAWITTGILYLLVIVGSDQFVHLPTADIGSFLEGAFAPLAFLWLVIGHFMQQKEISANTRAIKIQEESARRQELHARRDSYFKLLNLVQEQLGAIAGFLYMSLCGPTGSGEMSTDEFAELRSQSGSGDYSLFIRKLVGLAVDLHGRPEELRDMFFGTDIRARHSNNFLRTFDKLLDAARKVDTDEMVTDALLYGSPAGLLYRVMRHVIGEEEIDPIFSAPRSDTASGSG